jgi:hypothetical protein
MRRVVHPAIPSHFRDPVGLALRTLGSGRQGRFAVYLAGLNLLATPLDLALAVCERKLYARAGTPDLPIAFVCGPPRSGTTLVANAIARATKTSYFTNMTAVFPRAPITASRLFRAAPRNAKLTLRSHYGRTAGFRGWNDGLHLWDRWLGRDRQSVCQSLEERRGVEMVRFFGAFEQWTELPLVNKNNALNAHAAVVAEFLPTARFICLEREPLYLAQSLLLARSYIHGDEMTPYGLDDRHRSLASDPISDVCRQVRYHESLAAEQAARLGPDRFRILSYEDFCRDPQKAVRAIARDVLRTSADSDRVPASLDASRSQRVPDDVFRRLRIELDSCEES